MTISSSASSSNSLMTSASAAEARFDRRLPLPLSTLVCGAKSSLEDMRDAVRATGVLSLGLEGGETGPSLSGVMGRRLSIEFREVSSLKL